MRDAEPCKANVYVPIEVHRYASAWEQHGAEILGLAKPLRTPGGCGNIRPSLFAETIHSAT